MLDTAERIARRRSETLEGGGGSAAWEDLASATLGDVSASRMDAPSAPPGKSAASAFEIRFWVDIIAPCSCPRLNRRWRPLEAGHPSRVRLLDARFTINLPGGLRPLSKAHNQRCWRLPK